MNLSGLTYEMYQICLTVFIRNCNLEIVHVDFVLTIGDCGHMHCLLWTGAVVLLEFAIQRIFFGYNIIEWPLDTWYLVF